MTSFARKRKANAKDSATSNHVALVDELGNGLTSQFPGDEKNEQESGIDLVLDDDGLDGAVFDLEHDALDAFIPATGAVVADRTARISCVEGMNWRIATFIVPQSRFFSR